MQTGEWMPGKGDILNQKPKRHQAWRTYDLSAVLNKSTIHFIVTFTLLVYFVIYQLVACYDSANQVPIMLFKCHYSKTARVFLLLSSTTCKCATNIPSTNVYAGMSSLFLLNHFYTNNITPQMRGKGRCPVLSTICRLKV